MELRFSPQPLPQGLQEYSDDQPRDYHGRWTADGGGVGVAEEVPQRDNINTAGSHSHLVRNGGGTADVPVHNDSDGAA